MVNAGPHAGNKVSSDKIPFLLLEFADVLGAVAAVMGC